MAYKRKYMGASGGRYRKMARFGVNLAGRMAGNYARSYINNRFFKKSAPETGVTAQYDKVTQYSKKSMPRGKKRAWRKFVKKVNAVVDKSLGTRTVVFNSTITNGGTSTFQYQLAATLYGFCGKSDTSFDCGFRDIWRICNADNDVKSYNTDGVNPSKIVFTSGVIDFTGRNIGSIPIEVDMYEINVLTDGTKEPNFTDSVAWAGIATDPIPGAATPLGIEQRGTTLFDFPNLISQDRLKIYKKKKFFLPAGNTFTHQHRDPRNHYFNATELNITDQGGESSYGRRKMTSLYVFIAKSVVGANAEENVNFTVGVTRKYSYTINQSSKALDSFNPPN